MRFLFNSCCFCLPLHQGFVYIIYFDMLRLLWSVLFTILLFLRPIATVADYGFNALVLSTVFSMTFNALKSLNYGFLRNDGKMHKKYFCAKIFAVIVSIVKIMLLPKLNCSMQNNTSSICIKTQIDIFFVIEIIWTLFDIYFVLIVGTFCRKVLQGFYGPVGGTPIFFEGNERFYLENFKSAIPLAVKGYKIKNQQQGKIEKSFVVEVEEIKNKENKRKYFKIFPWPIFRFKKQHVTEVCDLSYLMESV